MSRHGRISDCQGVTNVIVQGSTAISAPPNAVGPDQSAGLYDKWMIAPSLGPLLWIPSEANTSQFAVWQGQLRAAEPRRAKARALTS